MGFDQANAMSQEQTNWAEYMRCLPHRTEEEQTMPDRGSGLGILTAAVLVIVSISTGSSVAGIGKGNGEIGFDFGVTQFDDNRLVGQALRHGRRQVVDGMIQVRPRGPRPSRPGRMRGSVSPRLLQRKRQRLIRRTAPPGIPPI